MYISMLLTIFSTHPMNWQTAFKWCVTIWHLSWFLSSRFGFLLSLFLPDAAEMNTGLTVSIIEKYSGFWDVYFVIIFLNVSSLSSFSKMPFSGCSLASDTLKGQCWDDVEIVSKMSSSFCAKIWKQNENLKFQAENMYLWRVWELMTLI